MVSIHRRYVVKGLGVSPLAAALPWSASAQQAHTPRRGGTLKVGVSDDNTKTLDPMLSVQQDERPKYYLIYNTLTGLRSDFSIEPDLAESWKIENDGKRYIFNL